MKRSNTLYVATRAAWREWLAKHHATAREVWLVYYKKQSGKPRIPYDDAVEEALCYGWIDSIVRSINEAKYAQRFTPRKPKSDWSESNLRRIKRLMAQGRMTPAGMALVPTAAEARAHRKAAAERRKAIASHRQRPVDVPSELTAALRSNTKAAACFGSLAPGYRRRYCGWIAMAKQPETRARRTKEAVRLLARGAKAFLK